MAKHWMLVLTLIILTVSADIPTGELTTRFIDCISIVQSDPDLPGTLIFHVKQFPSSIPVNRGSTVQVFRKLHSYILTLIRHSVMV